jgi:hypothetical protein
MCRPFSCIITKNQHVYTHPDPLEHSHTQIMRHFNLIESDKDPSFNGFVKIETYPKDNKSMITTPIDEWAIIVDEACIPSWYEDDKESFEAIIRKEASSWLNRFKAIDWNNKTPEECYYYALYVLKVPFPLVENTISVSAEYSYYYAQNVLKGPFPLGEEAIAKDADYSCWYAKDILKGPFELGEKAIAKDTIKSFLYASYVLKGPFKLGEVAITKEASYSYLYARNVLKERFLLGEETIKKCSFFRKRYESDLNINLAD